jgi:hypothetical protein
MVLARILWNFDLNAPKKERLLVFEEQQTFALWQRQPFRVELSMRKF